MNPDEAAYLGAHAWTRFLAAEDKSAVLEEAKKSLERAIKMNDKMPDNYYYLGSIYKFTNDLKNAERYYRRALELAPDYIEAKREIRLINTRKTESRNEKKTEKGFWSSIFKKH
jgi:tetratricopeptide (TPR) repeat protein